MVSAVQKSTKDHMTNDIKMHFCVVCTSIQSTNLTKMSHKKSTSNMHFVVHVVFGHVAGTTNLTKNVFHLQ